MPAGEPGVWSTTVPNRSPTLVIVSIVFLVITTAFWTFRQGWRWAHRQRGADDLMAACAYVVLLIQTVFGGIAVHYGFGKHREAIQPTLSKALLYFYLYQICYKLLGGFTKLTFCALYLRIFNQKGFATLVMVVSAIVAAGSLAFTLGTVFQCTPVHGAWDRRVPGHCVNNEAFWYSHAVFNIFFDIVVFIMPIPLIRTLKLARGQKTGLISIFCLGAFVIAAAVVRMVMLRDSAGSTDPTWGSTIALYWTEIEANTSVICCCLPALRVPFLNLWRRVREGKRSQSASHLVSPRQTPPSVWSGPQQSQPSVTHYPTKPQHVYQNDPGSNLSASKGMSMPSNSSSMADQKWLGRALHPTKNAFLRGISQDDLSRVEYELPDGLPQRLELGAIYKTTDLYMSTQTVRPGSAPAEEQRQTSLHDVLGEK
ncbi:hypothetical protein LTR35_001799 [Friedmanniomyces endolithicus]|uniref:Rhodopsin domain-containing protein n=1 Tax=Friedmanniomyces endolithicus TaxID=329885 RepID=A0AAN6FW48_9PEZI|nr:hypothetical protein LTR35_001799 [Friedmanniomyces endolithicus]KAK0296885.1 hypothetical protein LTS00_004685 [Friedmanniomyces endolithicus]KAK0325395.1 hypothetical protein LTR82_003678 [Friedmanniomyces endolithicus]KAK1011118.1 hypothetical protein LTR54_005036 [Friedmanniomyces endolithicus]